MVFRACVSGFRIRTGTPSLSQPVSYTHLIHNRQFLIIQCILGRIKAVDVCIQYIESISVPQSSQELSLSFHYGLSMETLRDPGRTGEMCIRDRLYTASTVYHSFDISVRVNRILQKLDHIMIFLLIAGSYTPLCMVTLRDGVGPLMCIIVWSIAAVGILIKACWITCPKWFSSIIYIGMGWVLSLIHILRSLPA